MRKIEGEPRDTRPYLQELFESAVLGVGELDPEQDDEALLLTASVACDLLEDSSVERVNRLVPLAPEEAQVWGKMDFNMSSEFLSKGGRALMDSVIGRAVAKLQQRKLKLLPDPLFLE